MASVNFPKSFDMTSKASSGAVPAVPSIVRIRSDNSTYTVNSSNSTDTIRIEIPTGGNGRYLFPNDSFITGKFTPTISGLTAGIILLDTCAYSFFRRIRILQGSNVLYDCNNCGRLWNALRDVSVGFSARSRDEICLGVEINTTTASSTSNYFSGITITSGSTYDFAFVLPAPLLGSLTQCAVPLGLMGAGNLVLELELNPSNVFFTTRVMASPDGAEGGATTANHTSSVVFSEIFYSMKTCKLDDMYQQALMSVYQNGVLLPSIEYINDNKVIPSGATIINEKLAFNRSSASAILWWLTNSNVASGVFTNYDLAEGVSSRIAGAVKDYTIQVSGTNLLDVKMGTAGGNYLFGSQALMQLHRIYNQAQQDGVGILNYANFCNILTTYQSCIDASRRFVGGYSLEKFDSAQNFQNGMSLVGQDVRLVINYDTALSESCVLYAYCMCEVAYEIRDGVVSVRT